MSFPPSSMSFTFQLTCTRYFVNTCIITIGYPALRKRRTLQLASAAWCLLAIARAIPSHLSVSHTLVVVAAAAAAMSHSSVAKRKHPPPPGDSSPKRTRTSTAPPDHLVELESQVHDLGAKVLAFRQKGLPFFARLSHDRVQPNPEGATDAAPTESKNAYEDLRQGFKERLAAANLMLPTLLEELVMWNTKIQQAVEVKRRDHRLPFLDEEENGM